MLSSGASGNNPDPSGLTSGTQVNLRSTTVDGTGVHVLLFSPSHRFLVPNNAAYQAYRTSTRPFMKGYSETVTLVPNDNSVWWHRRVVFTLKAPLGVTPTIQANLGAQATAGAVSTRILRDLSGQTTGQYAETNVQLQSILFDGTVNVDWVNIQTAKLDQTRVTILSDRRTTLSSGNNLARPRRIKFWHPINKTLVYDDDENGLSMTPSPVSVQSKPGCGNVYVVDFLTCTAPANGAESTIGINMASTLYWHEK